MHVMMAVDLLPVLEPHDLGSGLSPGHADEHDLVAQLVVVVKVRSLGDAGALKRRKTMQRSRQGEWQRWYSGRRC